MHCSYRYGVDDHCTEAVAGQWPRGVSVDDALKMQKSAPDDEIVVRPEEKKAA
jgi:hypothetical protein